MAAPNTIDLLNRLYVLHHRSLPVYLHYAPPYQLAANPHASTVLSQIVADQCRMADRIGALIVESGGIVDAGEFPMFFTGLHDLALDYLLKLLIERQERTIAACGRIADQLSFAPFAQALAREATGEAKGHLENLQELAGQPVGA
jgi:hypothetical protein